MAPFYYLYGTTLLYSIEESPDQGGDQNVTNLTTTTATTTTTAAAAAGGGVGVDGSGEEEAAAAAAVAPNNGSDEDMEIAWENLESARAILEKMVQEHKQEGGVPENDDDGKKKKKLLLDLAQVHLREGDLERLNGRFGTAIDDYEACLRLRLESESLGKFDRKIADVHYNLGLVYMLHAVQESNNSGGGGESGADTTAAAAAAASSTVSAEKIREWKRKSFEHSLECAKTLCGQVAFLCGTEPSAFFEQAAKSRPNYKTTGEEDGVDEAKKSQIKVSSELQNLRRQASQLQPTTVENGEELADLLGLLQEIQETIDEAETSEDGVHQVTQMKDQISQMASAAACGDEDGTTTATGFSAPSGNFGSSEGVASAAATATAAVAQTLQVRKKKKKRDGDDAKLPAKDDDGKRPAPSAE